MPYINCFWYGVTLGDLDHVCLLSMLRQNYKVRMFCYDPIRNVPSGIEIVDAREIMPRHELLFHRETGSPSLGSNKFRYLIMKKGLGIWLDTDVILIKQLPQAEDYIFGWQDRRLICGAVLYLPQNSSVLREIFDFVSQDYPIPPFYDEAKRFALIQKLESGHPTNVRDLPWGVWGPETLTYFIWKNKLMHFSKPREVFYPVHYTDAHVLFSSKYKASALLTPSTVAVHLWNTTLRHPSTSGRETSIAKLIIEKGSFLEEFARQQLGFRLSDSKTYGSSSRAGAPF